VRSEILTEKNLAAAASTLASRDKHLAAILKQYGPPPLWRRPQGFSTLVRIILEQQVSLASAASMYDRLVSAIEPFAPGGFIDVGEPYMRSLGVTRQKASYLLRLAESIEHRELRLRSIARMTDSDAKLALMSIKGIGSWSADIYLLMAMRRADVWPTGDLALATSVMEVKQLRERPSEAQLLDIAEHWRPYRAVGARMLWQRYLAMRKRMD
jgi:DNA-3-methyladenine glycosylase II